MSAPETPDPENPLEWVIKNHYAKKSQGTENVARLALLGTTGPTGDGSKVALKPWLERKDVPPEEFTVDLAHEYITELAECYSPGTQKNRTQYASSAYDILLRRNVEGFDYNPIPKVLKDYPNILQDITQNDVTIYEEETIKEVIEEQHPVNMTVSMTMLKTGRRIGGVLNLDLCDVHLDHPAADWQVHQAIRDKPDHIHFGPGVSEGETFRGETRYDGMKTKSRVPIPMDEELKAFLIWYLPIRRSSEHEGAFFINPRGVQEGQRLKSPAYREWLTLIAKDQGLFHGKSDPDNIRPHYWRHWTTTKMRDRIEHGTVDFFRGDKKAVSDIYNHYTPEKARAWTENIPKFYRPD